MNITYSKRSSFLASCEEAITRNRADLESGFPVQVYLGSGGYNGRVLVTISADDNMMFATNWMSSDPTRFPVRIKAAATALYNCSCFGKFEITHGKGTIRIIKA